MKTASWKWQHLMHFQLAVLLRILTACQPPPNPSTVTPLETAPLPILTSTPTGVSIGVPSQMEFVSQLTIGKINWIALSSKGDRLAVAAASGVYLYGVETLELIWSAETDGPVHQVVWLSDDQWLASVSKQRAIRIWDGGTGDQLYSLDIQSEDVFDLRWLPRVNRLVWLASDTIVLSWNPEEAAPIEIDTADLLGLGTPEGGPASYTPDLSLLALTKWKYLEDGDVTTGRLRSLMMMDVATRQAVYTVEDIGLYSLVTFSPDGLLLITGSSVRNPSMGEILRTLDKYPDSALNFTFSPDETRFGVLASGDSNQYQVYVWDVTTGELLNVLNSFEGHDKLYPITSIVWSPNGARLATSAMDRTVIVWDVMTGEPVQKITGLNTEAIQVEFSTDGTIIFMLTEDAHIVVWDVPAGDPLREIWSVSNIRKLAWVTDSSGIAALSVNDGGLVSNVYIWNVQTKELQEVRDGERFPQAVQVSPGSSSDQRMISADGSMIASIHPFGNQLQIQDAVTNELIFSAPVYAASGKTIAWSPTEPVLATTDGTARVLIWNAETSETRELTANNETFWQVSWSVDGALLAASSSSNVLIWDTTIWKLFQTIEGNSGVNQLAFSPDGKMLAIGSWDGVLSLWELIP